MSSHLYLMALLCDKFAVEWYCKWIHRICHTMVRKIKIKQQLARLHSQSQSSGYHWTRCIGFLIAQYTIWQHKLFFLTYRKYCWDIKFVRTTNHLNRFCLQIISYMFGLEIVFIRNIKNCVCVVVWRFIGLSFFVYLSSYLIKNKNRPTYSV